VATRDKSGRFVKGKHYSLKTEFKKDHVPWNKGKEHPFVKGDKNPMKRPEVRKKVSETNKIVIKNLYKEHPEIIQKIKENTKKAMQNPDVQQKIQKTWFKKGNIPWTKGRPRPTKTIIKIRNTLRELYKNNPELLKKMLTFSRPNKTEIKLDYLLQKYFPNTFKFVGDGSFVIEGLNPDWIDCDGSKFIIELFGEPWHEKEEERKRTETFAKHGYSTLVIWWKEMRNEKNVTRKIANFLVNEGW
jgi:very-short-patch-repair endonuclease